MSNFIYIMGKSSAGKDTIYQRLKDKITANVYVPYTTRPMREGEKQGREYNFISKEQFEQFIKQEKVMENRNYNVINKQGEKDIWTYATILDEQWNKEGDFLTIGTLESYTSILKYVNEHSKKHLNMLPVYIEISEEERRKRALDREQKQEKPNIREVERRLKADNIDFSQENLKTAGITKGQTFENYDLDTCIDEIVKYIQRERKVSLQEKYKVNVPKLEVKQTGKKDNEEEIGISH